MAKDIKYLDAVGLLTVLESLGLKFEDIENELDPIIKILFGKVNAEVGDIVLVNNKTLEKIVVKKTELGPYADTHTPIGVVVIPTSHDVYGTGECGVMSLLSASAGSPDTGVGTQQGMCYGQSGANTGLTVYDGTVTIGKSGEWWPATVQKYYYYSGVQLPINPPPTIDKCPNPDPNTDKQAGYDTADKLCLPSPYKANGSFNKDYALRETGEILNSLSDFDGKGNTEVLVSLATAQPDWKTAVSITNQSGFGYSPSACACWRYHTIGTKQGDWYLPACGELCYICPRRGVIADAFDRIFKVFKISCAEFPYGSGAFQSSTCASSNDIWTSTPNSGSVSDGNRSGGYYVRPFTRMEFVSNLPKNNLYEHLNEAREKLKDLEKFADGIHCATDKDVVEMLNRIFS